MKNNQRNRESRGESMKDDDFSRKRLASYETEYSRTIGETVELRPGKYEIATYSESGPSHSNQWMIAEKTIRGTLISTLLQTANVVVANEHGAHIVVIANYHDITVEKDF